MVESGFMSPAEAETKADSDLDAQLPNGLRTENTYVYAIQDDSGSMVGHAFIGKRHNATARELYRSLGYEKLSILMGKSIDL